MDKDSYEVFRAQEYLGDKSAERNATLYAPQLQEQTQQSQAVMVAQTDPEKVVEKIILELRGLKKQDDGTYVQWGNPKMNDKGIEWATYILRSLINQNIILSHLEDWQISKMMVQIGDSITDDLTLEWRSFGIKNKTDLDIIEDTLLFNIFASFNRALGQNEKNWLGRVSVEHISGVPNGLKQDKGGLLSKLRL